MKQSELLERAINEFSKKNKGKKPNDFGLSTAIEFSYRTILNDVTGVVFAENEKCANAFIQNQIILWGTAKGFIIFSIFSALYTLACLSFVIESAQSLISYITSLICILLVALLVLLVLTIKCIKNEKLFKNKIAVYTYK
jgi:CHASE2 domain-containing sensor protein